MTTSREIVMDYLENNGNKSVSSPKLTKLLGFNCAVTVSNFASLEILEYVSTIGITKHYKTNFKNLQQYKKHPCHTVKRQPRELKNNAPKIDCRLDHIINSWGQA